MMRSRILVGDVLAGLAKLRAGSVQTCVTSPPYFGLRDYGVDGQIGLEATPEAYVARLVDVFRAVRRVLADDGCVWLNLGDSYNSQPGQRTCDDKIGTKQATNRGSNDTGSRTCPGLKPKDLIGIPWRVAFALQADGWYLRQDIIWAKPNPMPESVRDRCTKAHEYVFLLSKNARYCYDADAIKTEGSLQKSGNTQHKYVNGEQLHRTKSGFLKMRGQVYPKVNRRSVWTITPKPFKGAHFAVFPEALVEPCILAGSRPGDLVLDPFAGSGTVGVVALRHGRRFVGTELNATYAEMAKTRIAGGSVLRAAA